MRSPASHLEADFETSVCIIVILIAVTSHPAYLSHTVPAVREVSPRKKEIK